MRIATWNIRGILEDHRLQELSDDIQRYDLDAVGVQETHLRGTGTIELPSPRTATSPKHKYTLYYTGPTNSSHHGVGIVIKSDCQATFKRISDRICSVTIENLSEVTGHRKIHIISSYAPTLKRSRQDPKLADDFYNLLDKTVNNIPSREPLFICADTNAQVGVDYKRYSSSIGQFGKGNINSNGERLGEFLVRNGLTATNTFFQHKVKHRVTWIHPNDKLKCRNQIDFILTRSNLRNTVTDSRSYHGTSLDTDHRIVICKCDIKWYKVFKPKKETKTLRLNVSGLKEKEVTHKYQNKVTEDIQNKSNPIKWSDIVDSVLTVGKEILGKQKPSNNKKNLESKHIRSINKTTQSSA